MSDCGPDKSRSPQRAPPPFHVTFYVRSGYISHSVLSFASPPEQVQKTPDCSPRKKETKSLNHYTLSPFDQSLNTPIKAWIDAYLERREVLPSLPLHLFSLPPFTQKVLRLLEKIQIGHTASYKQIAERAGSPKGARAIGNICHHNPYPLIIPCHRVIRSNGNVGGFAYESARKKDMLLFERAVLHST